jgi:hypothetical protein
MTFVDELERRVGARRRERLPCKLLIDGRHGTGTLRDLASGGLFVETPDPVPSGAGVVVAFRASDGERFVIEARSPRSDRVSNTLDGLAARGFALRIPDPPKSYLRWLEARA